MHFQFELVHEPSIQYRRHHSDLGAAIDWWQRDRDQQAAADAWMTLRSTIRAGPCCAYCCRSSSFQSGNTYGSTLWTHGKRDAPLQVTTPPITRCPGCENVFWIEEAYKIGGIDRWSATIEPIPEPWSKAFRELSEEEQYQAPE